MSEVRPLRERRGTQLVLLVLFVVVNLPLVHGTWSGWRLERDGRQVTATVIDRDVPRTRGVAEHDVRFRFDPGVDPDQRTWTAPVDETTYAAAEPGGPLPVRVLPGHPGTFRVHGQVRSHFVLVLTLAVDTLLSAIVVALWRRRATGDDPTGPMRGSTP